MEVMRDWNRQMTPIEQLQSAVKRQAQMLHDWTGNVASDSQLDDEALAEELDMREYGEKMYRQGILHCLLVGLVFAGMVALGLGWEQIQAYLPVLTHWSF